MKRYFLKEYIFISILIVMSFIEVVPNRTDLPMDPPQHNVFFYGSTGYSGTYMGLGSVMGSANSTFLTIASIWPAAEVRSTPRLNRNGDSYYVETDFKDL